MCAQRDVRKVMNKVLHVTAGHFRAAKPLLERRSTEMTTGERTVRKQMLDATRCPAPVTGAPLILPPIPHGPDLWWQQRIREAARASLWTGLPRARTTRGIKRERDEDVDQGCALKRARKTIAESGSQDSRALGFLPV